MSDYSQVIEKAVYSWMEANKETVVKAIEKQVHESMEAIIAGVSGSVMYKMGKFLDDNKDDLIASIAAAIAASYNNRHPS